MNYKYVVDFEEEFTEPEELAKHLFPAASAEQLDKIGNHIFYAFDGQTDWHKESVEGKDGKIHTIQRKRDRTDEPPLTLAERRHISGFYVGQWELVSKGGSIPADVRGALGSDVPSVYLAKVFDRQGNHVDTLRGESMATQTVMNACLLSAFKKWREKRVASSGRADVCDEDTAF